MKRLILFPLVFLLFCSTPISAQENPVYAETVAWWRGVIQELQPYREQLQNLYADTEARSQFERGKIEGEFRQRLVREYPGSSFFAGMGGTWQVNGHTRIGFDRNWQIHKLIQKFGSLTKTYDFRQNLFIVEEGLNRISLKLDLRRPQGSYFVEATIPAIAVSAEQVFHDKSSGQTALKDILNAVVANESMSLRMDVLAEKMVVDLATRQEVLSRAGDLSAAGNLAPSSTQEGPAVAVSIATLLTSPGASYPNRLLPWVACFLGLSILAVVGLKLVKVLLFAKRIRSLARTVGDVGEYFKERNRDVAEDWDWGMPSPQEATSKNGAEIKTVPREWSLEVLQSLEWKRFETVCAEHIGMTGYEPKETRIGADGGVDIWVYKPGIKKAVGIVQCKAWKSYKVGVKPVRELLGVMAKEKVAQGKFITSGEFTAEALAFVEGEKLKLITGEMFLTSIRKLPPEKQKELLEIAVSGDYRTPTCPQCGVKMTLRQGQGEWRDFWGCPSYPRCKATLVYKSDTV
ncbi:MAG: restriction endonuclease [Saccharofermentanales bacterium]|nr:restriction endonuclease [Desulfomicrobium apsheronum]